MVVILYHIRLVIIHPLVVLTKAGPIIRHLGLVRINVLLLVMVELVLVIVPTTSPNIKLILAHTGMMGGFGHISVISNHPLWCQIVLRIIQLVLLLVIHLVLLMVMFQVILVLGPPTYHPRKLRRL